MNLLGNIPPIFKEISSLLFQVLVFTCTFYSIQLMKMRYYELVLPDYLVVVVMSVVSSLCYIILHAFFQLSAMEARSYVLSMIIIGYSEITDEKYSTPCLSTFAGNCLEMLFDQLYPERLHAAQYHLQGHEAEGGGRHELPRNNRNVDRPNQNQNQNQQHQHGHHEVQRRE